MTGIVAQDLAFGFGEHHLFRGVDLTLRPGEVVGLIGPPESGKSVLLKLLAGLLDPTSGSVSIDGERFQQAEATRYSLRRRIGMVFQNTALFDSMTLFENVAFPLRGQGLERAEIGARVEERLAAVGLGHAQLLYPHTLSGGMKKRAGIARATITNPRYCFYDEPTAGLDPVTSAKIYALIHRFAKEQRAGALIISNELDTLLAACDRVLMLYNGAIVFSGPPSQILSAMHPAVRQFASGANEGPL
jgi:phospholipid/cholesterol/gamma-HCH transport system ATP-binding protein